jgi:hypothetical protein
MWQVDENRPPPRRMAAMRLLHCNMTGGAANYPQREVKRRSLTMGFFTELFSRPRPREHGRYRASLAVLNAVTAAERNEIHIKPADFPRVARQGIRC